MLHVQIINKCVRKVSFNLANWNLISYDDERMCILILLNLCEMEQYHIDSLIHYSLVLIVVCIYIPNCNLCMFIL